MNFFIREISVGNSTQTALSLISTDGDAASAPTLQLYRDSASAIAGDSVGIIEFKNNNDAGKDLAGSIGCSIDSVVTADSTSMQFKVKRSGVEVDNFRIRYSEVVVNEDSVDCDFRVETGGNLYGFHVDAAKDTVGIGGIGADEVALHVFDDGNQDTVVRIESNDTDAGAGPILDLFRNTVPLDNDVIGRINFSGNNSLGAKVNYGSIETTIIDESGTSTDGTIKFRGLRNNSEVEWLRLQGSGVVINNVANSNLDVSYYAQGFSTSDSFVHFDNSNAHVNIGTGLGSTSIADNNPLLQVQGSISGKMPVIVANANLTLTRSGMSGQTYVCTDGGTTALTMPLGALQGDYFYFVSSSGGIQIVVDVGTQTLNGATTPITRSTDNEIYTVLCITDNKFILSNPA